MPVAASCLLQQDLIAEDLLLQSFDVVLHFSKGLSHSRIGPVVALADQVLLSVLADQVLEELSVLSLLGLGLPECLFIAFPIRCFWFGQTGFVICFRVLLLLARSFDSRQLSP